MLLFLAAAFAADLAPDSTTPVIFPGGGLDVGIELVRCVAEVTVDAEGAVAALEVPRTDECPEPFAAAVHHAVAEYRYPKGDDGRQTQVKHAWRLKSTAFPTMTPAEMQRILDAHEVVPLGVEHCEIRLRIATDGAIAKLRTSEVPRCLVMPLGPARNPARLRKRETEAVKCTARFTSDRGVASDVDLSECPTAWQLPADVALRNWQWQTGPDFYEDYVVRFVFLVE
ncbi:MAG: hypothetical protein EP330_10880 [Deltaproteobacteria bacterium]|nr:MAG: hypothetical protein EP330_10880 [Deltaproteobacteria bacterium]